MTNLILSETNQGNEDAAVLMVRAVASILIGHPERALKDLASPAIGNGYDSQLWKGFAFARQEKWAEAREKFKNAEFSIAALPLELQRIVTADAMRASLEVKDYAGASRRRSELEVIGIPDEMKPEIAVLRGRLAEALGHDKDALDAYTYAAQSRDREASAEARLLEALLRHRRGELGQAELHARTGDIVGHLARRRDRVEDAEQAGRSLRQEAGAMPTRSPPPRPRRRCSPIPNCRGRARTQRPHCSPELYLELEGRRHEAGRRARACSTSSAN